MEASRDRTMRQILKSRTNQHALFSSTMTLVLGIMGSAVLVVSAAFSATGIICGFFLMSLVAIVNAYTSDLLIRQCQKTGTTDYDTLTYAVGGPIWRFISQVGIVVLLLGTLIGGIIQVGEGFGYGLDIVSSPPGWLVNGSGRMIMVFCTIAIVAPLCLPENLTSLDKAGVGGFVLVCFLTIWIMVQCCIRGFPAIPDGFPIAGFGPGTNGVVNSISSFGFAFYIQPIMLPMLIEMPNGKDGARILSWAVRFTILGAAFVTYGLMGFFSAAWFGQDTEGNILENNLGKKEVQAFLNISIALYIALSLPPVLFPTRQVLDAWLPGRKDRRPLLRKVFLITFILCIMLLVALLAPGNSGKTLIVTAATGVLIASYFVPVVNHYFLYFGWARCQRRYMEPDVFWAEPLFDSNESAGGFLGRPPPGTQKRVSVTPSQAHVSPGGVVPAHAPAYDDGSNHAYHDTASSMTELKGQGLGKGSLGKEAALEDGGLAGEPFGEPLSRMDYRVKYRSKILEWTFELFWPLCVLGVGLFASIAALTIINDA
mmetsp:Transcript_12290/g.36966  ORF Transcript_12290/g.36966 Transcript_12290/m.36966 type:complete len:541 (-) Transcript_12290:2518-4140(-)